MTSDHNSDHNKDDDKKSEQHAEDQAKFTDLDAEDVRAVDVEIDDIDDIDPLSVEAAEDFTELKAAPGSFGENPQNEIYEEGMVDRPIDHNVDISMDDVGLGIDALDMDVEITGDEEIDFADEKKAAKGGGFGAAFGNMMPAYFDFRRYALPGAVILGAVGVGLFIVMGPLSGGSKDDAPVEAPAPARFASADEVGAPMSEVQASSQFAYQGFESLPQPNAARNNLDGLSGRVVETRGYEVDSPVIYEETPPEQAELGLSPPTSESMALPNEEDIAANNTPSAPSELTMSMDDVFGSDFVPSMPKLDGSEQQVAMNMNAPGLNDAPGGVGMRYGTGSAPVVSEVDVETPTMPSMPVARENSAPTLAENNAQDDGLDFEPVDVNEIINSLSPPSRAPQEISNAEAPAMPPMPQVNAPSSSPVNPSARVNVQQPSVMPPTQPAQTAATNNSPSETIVRPVTGLSNEAAPPRASNQQQAQVYYEAAPVLPPTGAGAQMGTRKVNPLVEPASQFIIVRKVSNANDFETLVVSAKRALDLRRYDAALDLYTDLQRRNARDPRVLMGLAIAQQMNEMHQAALQTYESLLDIDPENPEALSNMLGLLREQFPAVALRRLEILRDKNPTHPAVVAQLGLVLADVGDFDRALKSLGMAASLEPRNPLHIFNMAIILDRMGDKSRAAQMYQEALDVDAMHGSGRAIDRDVIHKRLSSLRQL
jgi:Flp pilus assembly protein TadD